MSQIDEYLIILSLGLASLIFSVFFRKLFRDHSNESYEYGRVEMQKHFLLQFHMDLKTLEKSNQAIFDGEDKIIAYQDVFRVYHTLKGDSQIFPELYRFSEYVKKLTDIFRDLQSEGIESHELHEILISSIARLLQLSSDRKPTFQKFMNFTFSYISKLEI